jgi:hypothetical protein
MKITGLFGEDAASKSPRDIAIRTKMHDGFAFEDGPHDPLGLFDAQRELRAAEQCLTMLQNEGADSARLARAEKESQAAQDRVDRLKLPHMIELGSIDLRAPGVIQIPDRSILIDLVKFQAVLIPTVTLDVTRQALTDDQALKQYLETGHHFGKFSAIPDGIEQAENFIEALYAAFYRQRRWRGQAPPHNYDKDNPWWSHLAWYEPFDPDHLDHLSSDDRNDYVRLYHKQILKKIQQLRRTGMTEYDVFPPEMWERWIDEAFNHENPKPVTLASDKVAEEASYVELNPLLPYIHQVDDLIRERKIEPQDVVRIDRLLGKHNTSLGPVLSIMLYHGYALDSALQELRQYVDPAID